ncbi:Uncharacterized protein HZ326_15221 [Fusarium oxysporum f. sp. albedinis]|nr:Uncharacterized protein HZ326_15221 [Fusarium oxysporum f. sp. albedinis]
MMRSTYRSFVTLGPTSARAYGKVLGVMAQRSGRPKPKQSPVAIVVSQLDKRYFNSFHGQYSFRPSFRIYHETDSGVRPCVVESRGNYLMSRSDSVELPKFIPVRYKLKPLHHFTFILQFLRAGQFYRLL